MKLIDYNHAEYNIKALEGYKLKQSVIPALLLLLSEAKELLFPNGKYKRLRWMQFGRIWKLAKIAVRLITTLIAVFK